MNNIHNNKLAQKIKRAIKKEGKESGYNTTLNLKSDAANIVTRYKLDIKAGIASSIDVLMCWDVEKNYYNWQDNYGTQHELILYDALTIRELAEMEEVVYCGLNSEILEIFDTEGNDCNWTHYTRNDLIIKLYIGEMLYNYIDDKYSIDDLNSLID